MYNFNKYFYETFASLILLQMHVGTPSVALEAYASTYSYATNRKATFDLI